MDAATHRPPRLPLAVKVSLAELLQAYDYALDLSLDPWEFAVELSALRSRGLSQSDARWLVRKGLVQCAMETTVPGDTSRTFRECEGLVWQESVGLVLTKAGQVLAITLRDRRQRPRGRRLLRRGDPRGRSARSPRTAQPKPRWDRELQELRVGDVIVKQYRVPADNQETILAAFEEEGWPPRIDDPLAPRSGQHQKRRLHDTISSLNRNQKVPLLRFFGDGSGEGVRWDFRQLDRQNSGAPAASAGPHAPES